MIKDYNIIKDKLDDIKFCKIINGFKRCSFAIFNDKQAVIDGKIIDRPSQFVANSTAEYNGNLIATVYHDFLPNNLKSATALIVHEMYHVFQFGEMDYKKLLLNHSENNGIFYNYSIDNITLKYNEVRYLINAYLNSNEKDYRRFLTIRKLREKKYPKELLYENVTEVIEGAATYVEFKALEQLDEKLFIKEIAKTIDILRNFESYFSIRELSYKVGALMLFVLEKLKINLNRVAQCISFISDVYAYNYIEPKIEKIVEIKDLIIKKNIKNKESVDQFFLKNYRKVDYDEIIGYNSMGVIRFENKLLVKFLVIIKIYGEEKSLNGDFCLIFDDNRECIKLYKLMK